MFVINPASSSHAIWRLCSPSSKAFPPLLSLCTVPVESPVSVHYLISGGIDCGDSLIHIHIRYKHNWSSAEHWERGGSWGKIYTRIGDHRPSSGIRTACVQEGTKRCFDKDVTRSNLSLEPAAEHRTLSAIWGKGSERHSEKCSIICAASHWA